MSKYQNFQKGSQLALTSIRPCLSFLLHCHYQCLCLCLFCLGFHYVCCAPRALSEYYLSSHFASRSHPRYQHRDHCMKSSNFCLSTFGLQHSFPSWGHKRRTPTKWESFHRFCFHLTFSRVSLKSPWNTIALHLNLIQVLLSLAFLSVVNNAFLLVVRKLLKVFCPSHSF